MSCGSSLANACPECPTDLPTKAGFCLSCGHQLAQSTSAKAAAPDTSAETSRSNPERCIPPELLDKLEAARAGGKTEGERRALCHILPDLADLSERRRNPEKANGLLLWAQKIVSEMADATVSREMRAMFMNSAKIKDLMNSP